MLIKTKITFASLLIIGFASAAMAENSNIGDRYPLLEQSAQQSGTFAYAFATEQRQVKRYTAGDRAMVDRVSPSVDR